MENEISLIALISTFYIFGLCAFYTGFDIAFAAAVCALLIFLCLVNRLKPTVCFVLCLMFFGGMLNAKVQDKTADGLSEITSANNTIVEGRVYSIPHINKEKKAAKFYLKAHRAKVFGKETEVKNTKILVSIYDYKERYKDVKIGDIVEIKGNLRQPEAPSNPSEFDYKNYLKHKDVFCILYVDTGVKKADNRGGYRVVSHPDVWNSRHKAEEIWWKTLQLLDLAREDIIKRHSKYIKSPALEVFGGIVFGDDAVNPPDEVKQSFINSGLLHLLAASGLNVALVFGIWWAFSGLLNLGYRARIVSGGCIIILYVFMTGFPPSILRASIMLILILAGKLMFKTADSLAVVFFTGLIMLAVNPKLIFDVGFELSFLVTGGLIICIEPLCGKFKKQDKAFKKAVFGRFKNLPNFLTGAICLFSPVSLAGMVFVPLVAQLWAAPLQMYYFNTFTPWSMLANIAVVPFIGIISFMGFASSIIVYILKPLRWAADGVAMITATVLNPLINILLSASEYFSKLPCSIIKMPSGSVFQIILYYILILAIVQGVKKGFKKNKLWLKTLAVLGILAITLVKVPSNGSFEILAFDVGNADSFLIKTQTGKYIMIDTGKLPYRGASSAKRTVLEYLYDKNIRTLEKLVVTHFDNDHSGGTIDILENINVKEVIIQTDRCDTENSCAIINYMKKHKITPKIAKNNEVIYKEHSSGTGLGASGADFEVITLMPEFHKKTKMLEGEENETSIAVLIKSEYEKQPPVYALFMADGGVSAYNSIKNGIPKGIAVLKAGHHGAKNVVDKKMLEYLKPQYTIISTGKNPYGHPDPNTIRLLDDSGSKIYSTKDFGAIQFIFKPDGKINILTGQACR